MTLRSVSIRSLATFGLFLSAAHPSHAAPVCIPGEYLAVVREGSRYDGRVSALNGRSSILTALGEAQVVREFANLRRNGKRVMHITLPLSANPEAIAAASNPDLILAPNCLNSVDGSVAESVDAQSLMQPMGAAGPSLPAETFAAALWGLDNVGQDGGIDDVDVDAPEAWQLTKGDPSIVVAIIDSGVDYTHPDLSQNMWRNPGEIPGNGFDDDSNGLIDDVFGADLVDEDGDPRPAAISEPLTPIMVARGHGTHVAGTVAAVENGLGVIGVAPQVKIMAVRVLGADGRGSDAQILAGIDYVLGMRRRGVNVRVANASLGGEQPCPQAYVQTLSALGDAGVLFVAAAGNGGQDGIGDNIDRVPNSPAGCPNNSLISVANITRTGSLAGSSNFGPAGVDLAAPGTEIWSAFPNRSLLRIGGTSMAAPHVAGVAALLFSEEPGLTPADVRLRLMETAKPISGLSGTMNAPGIVSAARALNGQKAFDLRVELNSTTTSAKAGSGSVALKLTAKLFDPSARVRGGFVEVTVGKKKYKGTLRKKSAAAGFTTVQTSGTVPYTSGKISARFVVELNDGTLLVTERSQVKIVVGGRVVQRAPKPKVNFSGNWTGQFSLTSSTCATASPGFAFDHRISQKGTRVTLIENASGGLTFAGTLNEKGFSASARAPLNGCEVTSTMQYSNPLVNSSNANAIVRLNCGAIGACQVGYSGVAKR